MSASVQNLLDSFELLAEVEKQELASEIIRRTAYFDFPSLTDEELVLNAEAIFLELDNSESINFDFPSLTDEELVLNAEAIFLELDNSESTNE